MSHSLIKGFNISMTKLLDADWLRSRQYFINYTVVCSAINDFGKTNKMAKSKMAERYLNMKKIAQEELKAK